MKKVRAKSETDKTKQMIEFDLVLDKIGHLGRFQVIICIMLSYTGIQASLHAVSSVFYAGKTPHRCNVPPIDNSSFYPNLTETDILNYTTPLNEKNKFDRCKRFNVSYESCEAGNLDCIYNRTYEDTMACDQGFHYDTSQYKSTIITEWDLVCDRSIWASIVSSVFMAGMWTGAIISGYLLDFIGRRYSILVMAVGSLISGLCISAVQPFWAFVVLRFIVAACSHGAFMSSFVYIVEVTGNSRTGAGMHLHTAFSIAYAVNSLFAYFLRDWRQYYFAISLTPALYFIFHLFIPESPRWHFSNGRIKKGIAEANRFAAGNGVVMTPQDYEDTYVSRPTDQATTRSYNCFDLFRPKHMRWVVMNMMFSWMVISMVYYGLSLNAGSLAGDIYLNNALNGILEIIGYFIVQFTMDKYGRRTIMSSFFFIQGFGCLGSAVLKELANGNRAVLLTSSILAFAGKVFNAGSFGAVYNFTAELFPTVIRGNAVGLGSMAARVGSICSPFILFLEDRYSWLPATVFGVFGVAGGIFALFYPETMNRYMPQTITEAELFYSGKGDFKHVDEEARPFHREKEDTHL